MQTLRVSSVLLEQEALNRRAAKRGRTKNDLRPASKRFEPPGD